MRGGPATLLLALLLATGLTSGSMAGTPASSGWEETVGGIASWPEWQDPTIVQVNKLPPAATHFSYATVEAALRGTPLKESNFQLLNGNWRFQWAARPADAPTEFWRRDFDAGGWRTIPVPADWVRQGYGRYQYLDEEYLFPLDPPRVPKDDNPVGTYVQQFTIPDSWRGQKIVIHFGSVRTVFYLWVNGRRVGYSEDSRLPAEFDITSYVQPGSNRLALQVLQWADAAYLECQDMWRMGGIERDVYLYATPKTRVRDIFMRSSLGDDYRKGTFDLDVATATEPGALRARRVRMTLRDGGQIVYSSDRFTESAATQGLFNLRASIPGVKQWTAETPNLYSVVIELLDGSGRLIEATSLRTGFRRIEISNGVLLVNGRPIMIHGINHQEFDPDTMHVISRAQLRRDVELMKRFNINALRFSHSPRDPYLYDLADEYGLYLIDEANIESHGAWNENVMLADRPEFRAAHLSRMEGMVERDKNHPSVIIWSLGNEAGSGASFRENYQNTKRRDPSRPVQYEAAGDVDYTDMYVPQYAKAWDISKYLSTWPKKPLIMIEFAHMQGNSGGTVHDYARQFYVHPQSQGGFVWDFVDTSLKVTQPDGSVYYGYPGNLVEEKIEYSFSDGIFTSTRDPHPQAWDVKKAFQPVTFQADLLRGDVILANRYDFRDLSGLAFSWRVERDGKEVARGLIADPAVPARTQARIHLSLPVITPVPGSEYFLTIEARSKQADGLVPADHLVAWEQFQLPLYVAPPQSAEQVTQKLSVTQTGEAIQVSGSGFVATFSKSTGMLTGYTYAGRELLSEGLQPHFWRASTDNDVGAKLPERLALWKSAASTALYDPVLYAAQADGSVLVHSRSTVADRGARFDVAYRIELNGAIGVTFHFEPQRNGLPFLPRLGLRFTVPGSYGRLEWFGRGPQASYWDRYAAAPIGRYEGAVADQFQSYVRPQESGNKVDIRWLAVRNAEGWGMEVVGAPTFSGSALNMLDEDFDYSPVHQLQIKDLKARDITAVNVDMAQMGLGGDDSWRSTAHPEYLIWPRVYDFGFTLRPLSRGDDADVIAHAP